MNEKEFIFNKCKKMINTITIRKMIKGNIIQVILLCFQLFIIPMITDKVSIAICVFLAWLQTMMILFNIYLIINIRSELILKLKRELECGNIVLTEKGNIYIKEVEDINDGE